MATKKKSDEKEVIIPKNAADLQRMKLEKLMSNPDKEVYIPEKSKEWNPRAPQEFIRNIWGSSAGAGSGDFHVYRGIRRREYARQKFINEKSTKEEADEQYHAKIEENIKAAEERTAKKRAKRQKKKQKMKSNKKMKKEPDEKEESEDEDEEEEEPEDSKNEACGKDEVGRDTRLANQVNGDCDSRKDSVGTGEDNSGKTFKIERTSDTED